MNLHLTGRTAAVAAASAGLGFASAYTLAAEGCNVAICARDPDRLEQAAARIRAETGRAVLAVPMDMGTLAGPAAFVHAAADRFGALDIAIANAGGPPSGRFDAIDNEDWEQAFQLNLQATVRLFRAALPHLRQSDQGRLLAITSISARQPVENLLLSNAMRAGVHGTIKTLSREIADTGVTVNAVCPGVVQTDRVNELARQEAAQTGVTVEEAHARRAASMPMGRLGDPMEFGAAVAFLGSRQAAFITGIGLPVDGGLLAGIP